MTKEQIEQGCIEKLGRISPAFIVGAEWMQDQMIYKVRKELEGLSDAFKFLADIGRPSYGIDVDKVIESLLNENKE